MRRPGTEQDAVDGRACRSSAATACGPIALDELRARARVRRVRRAPAATWPPAWASRSRTRACSTRRSAREETERRSPRCGINSVQQGRGELDLQAIVDLVGDSYASCSRPATARSSWPRAGRPTAPSSRVGEHGRRARIAATVVEAGVEASSAAWSQPARRVVLTTRGATRARCRSARRAGTDESLSCAAACRSWSAATVGRDGGLAHEREDAFGDADVKFLSALSLPGDGRRASRTRGCSTRRSSRARETATLAEVLHDCRQQLDLPIPRRCSSKIRRQLPAPVREPTARASCCSAKTGMVRPTAHGDGSASTPLKRDVGSMPAEQDDHGTGDPRASHRCTSTDGGRELARASGGAQAGETLGICACRSTCRWSWEGDGIGAICICGSRRRPFTDKEDRAARTFADQAVIAIQNARLFKQAQEARAAAEAPTRPRARSSRR